MGRNRSRSPVKRERRRSRSHSRDRERDLRHRDRDIDRDRDARREREKPRVRERHRSRSHSPPPPRHRRSRTPPPPRRRRSRDRSASPGSKHSSSKDSVKASSKQVIDRPVVSEKDLEGKTEDEVEMLKLMGFATFDTTKGKHVSGNTTYVVNTIHKRKYRQYMNRKGGFNRPLDFVA